MYNHTYNTYIHTYPGGSATAVLDGSIGVMSYGDGLEGRASGEGLAGYRHQGRKEGSGQDHAHQVRVAYKNNETIKAINEKRNTCTSTHPYLN